jgi:hypothetical protein
MPKRGTLTVILTPTASYRICKIPYLVTEIQIQIHVIYKTAVSINQILLHNKTYIYSDKNHVLTLQEEPNGGLGTFGVTITTRQKII